MKGAIKVLVTVAAILTVVGVISRMSITPVLGLESRTLGGCAALLLLFVIALEGIKQ